MPKLVSAPFFSATPVFDRAEYAGAVGRRSEDKVVTAMLAQHLKAGNIKRIARGVFASVPKHADSAKWSVDQILAASRLRSGCVIAYHSALELHGCAYTDGHLVQVIAPGEPGIVETAEFLCQFVTPPRGISLRNDSLSDGVTVVDRMGLEVNVTTIERTIADVFDRYDLVGGVEELFKSLDLVPRVDPSALVRHVSALGNATAAGALGFWLEQEQERLSIDDGTLNDLRALAPRQVRYALGTKPGAGRTAVGWNVILPVKVLEPRFEGL